MNNNSTVTIARTVELSEILTDGSFDYRHVVDLRRCERGNARPVEEAILKRLKNHFISYDQVQMNMDEVGPCEEVHLGEMLQDYDGNVLLISEEVAQVAHLCNIYKIPFTSKVFYVVETGKGDVVKPFEPTPVKERQPARFGSFGA